MNCAEKLLEPTIFFNLYTNHHRNQVPKVHGARDRIYNQACRLSHNIRVISIFMTFEDLLELITTIRV